MYSIIPILRTSKSRGFVQLRLYAQKTVVYFKTAIAATGKDLKDGVVDHWPKLQNEIDELKKKIERIPNFNTLDAKQICDALQGRSARDISFNAFALKYLAEIEKRGAKRTDVMWSAVKSLKSSLGKSNPTFADFTVAKLQAWYDNLAKYKRIRTLYPLYVRKIYEAGMRAYNDPDNGVILIKPYPSEYLIIPKGPAKGTRPAERALSVAQLRSFIYADLDAIPLKGRRERQETRAICMLSFCLAGANIADLYDLKEANLENGILWYNRRKVMDRRADRGYIEFRLPLQAKGYLEQLQEDKKEDMLTNISAHHVTNSACSRHIIKTLRTISKALGLPHITPFIIWGKSYVH